MTEQTLKAKFEIKELQLNALLEITQAINNNLPEESLYKIYNFTLRSNLNIQKLALFVLDDEWSCKVSFGNQKTFPQGTPSSRIQNDTGHHIISRNLMNVTLRSSTS